MTWLAALGFAHKHWKSVGFLILVASVGLYIAALKGEVRHEHKLRTKAETALTQCAQGRAADRKSYVDGQTAVRLQHEAAKRADEALHEQIRKDANDTLKPSLDAVHARIADFVRRGGATPGPAQGTPQRPDLPGTGKAAAQSDGPYSDPLVPTSLSDLNICAENTVRLKNGQAWALDIGKADAHD